VRSVPHRASRAPLEASTKRPFSPALRKIGRFKSPTRRDLDRTHTSASPAPRATITAEIRRHARASTASSAHRLSRMARSVTAEINTRRARCALRLSLRGTVVNSTESTRACAP
jgi:hypothetical protein